MTMTGSKLTKLKKLGIIGKAAGGSPFITRAIRDTFIRKLDNTNYGSNTIISLKGLADGNARLGLLTFSLSGIPVGVNVSSVNLYLYNQLYSGPLTIYCYPLASGRVTWIETEANWSIYSAGNNWTTAGCGDATTDYDGTALLFDVTFSSDPGANGEYLFPSTANAVSYVQSNIGGNVHLFLQPQASGTSISIHSRENGVSSLAPKLIVEYV